MSTPINEFQDILDAMERDPELAKALRRHVLSDELLHVPARVIKIENDIKSLTQQVTRIGGDVSNLKGDDYESFVAMYIHRTLRRNLDIHATVFSTQKNMQPLIELLDEAEDEGKITREETDKLNETDMVLRVNGKDEFILGEISVTIQQRDVQRASEWAAILARATGATVSPLAIGTTEENGLDKGNVQVILVQQYQET